MRDIVESIESEYTRYRRLGEKTLKQLNDEQVLSSFGENGNSVVILVCHVSGNLKSRFTDFLTTDGEKPWRERDSEFTGRIITRDELSRIWDEGWNVLFATLSSLTDHNLAATVRIRGIELTVQAALHRSLAHVAYHVGQIVLIARTLLGEDWEFLSIPPGMSNACNRNPTLEKESR